MSIICFFFIIFPPNQKAHPEGCAEKVFPSVQLPHHTDKSSTREKERTPFTKVVSLPGGQNIYRLLKCGVVYCYFTTFQSKCKGISEKFQRISNPAAENCGGHIILSSSTIYFNRPAHKLCCAIGVLVDIVFKAFIRYVHLTKSRKYLICAGVVVFGDIALQSLYKALHVL